MELSKVNDEIDKIVERTATVQGRGEQATKQSMVLPMLDALGYDIWNPNEVCPEFEADTAVKKAGQKEKVDFAILLSEIPRIFIEVKELGTRLDGHEGQLKRYFNSTPTVSLGILTNGLEYRFYTDTGDANIQDTEPFHIVQLDSIESHNMEVLLRLHKDVFSAESIRDYATELIYRSKIFRFLKKELDVQDGELSDELVGWILRTPGMYEGRVTTNILERFRPIAKYALQRVLKQLVRRAVADIDASISTSSRNPEPAGVETDIETNCATETDDIIEENLDDSDLKPKGIHTTEEELECFAIVKQIFEESECASSLIFDPSARQEVPIEIGYKDTTGYFNIFFNKPSWWNMRICVERKTKWVGFDLANEEITDLLPENLNILPQTAHANLRIEISGPSDLLAIKQIIQTSFSKTIDEREKLKQN